MHILHPDLTPDLIPAPQNCLPPNPHPPLRAQIPVLCCIALNTPSVYLFLGYLILVPGVVTYHGLLLWGSGVGLARAVSNCAWLMGTPLVIMLMSRMAQLDLGSGLQRWAASLEADGSEGSLTGAVEGQAGEGRGGQGQVFQKHAVVLKGLLPLLNERALSASVAHHGVQEALQAVERALHALKLQAARSSDASAASTIGTAWCQQSSARDESSQGHPSGATVAADGLVLGQPGPLSQLSAGASEQEGPGDPRKHPHHQQQQQLDSEIAALTRRLEALRAEESVAALRARYAHKLLQAARLWRRLGVESEVAVARLYLTCASLDLFFVAVAASAPCLYSMGMGFVRVGCMKIICFLNREWNEDKLHLGLN